METSEPSDLAAEVSFLKKRVEALERRLGATPIAPAPRPTAPAASPPAPQSSESQVGQILGVVAALCFVLAGAYLIKLAIDSGWLTPARQLGMAAAFGLSLIGAGLALSGRDLPYSGILPGAGVVILYMTAYGGSLYYGLYGPWAAAGAAAAATAIALGLFRVFRHDFYVVVAAVGTYLSPLLLPVLRGASLDSMTFFLFWDAAFTALAIGLKTRGFLTVACYLALGVFAATSPAGRWGAPAPDLGAALFFQLLQFCVFAGGSVLYSVRHQSPMTTDEAWSAFPVLLFFYGLEYAWLSRLAPQAAPWLALGFAAAVYGLYLAARERLAGPALDSGPMVAAFLAIVLFHSVYLELLPGRWCPWFAVLLAASLPAFSGRLDLTGRHGVVGLAVGAVLAIEYLKAAAGHQTRGWELASLNLVIAGLMVALFAAAGRSEKRIAPGVMANDDAWLAVLLAGEWQALLGLSRLVHQAAPGGAERFLVTGAWALFGAGLVLWSRQRRDPLLARSALLALGAAAAKGLLLDVSGNQPVVRILCLVLLGAALYFSGLLFREAKSWEEKRGP